MRRSTHNPWLSRYAWFTAFCTLVLICFGGLVTSHGAGLAVPDWPNTYGYNMFFFPVSQWVGGIFYEHTHRLVASGVGLLTTVLALWLWRNDSRRWLRWLGVVAFLLVVVQGVLGGLRVTLLKDEIGIFHGALAQLFFVVVTAIALFTTEWWENLAGRRLVPIPVRHLFLAGTGLVFLQLTLGAAMRHQHAGLAIPDFPLAYGRLWPATDAPAIERYNQQRIEVNASRPITATHVILQMTHRVMALAILVAVGFCARRTGRTLGWSNPLTRFATGWLGLIVIQIGLGAATIWTGKSADIATAHVAVGALSLVTGALGAMVASRAGARFPEPSRPASVLASTNTGLASARAGASG